MQILHPFAGSLQQYIERLADPDCYRPGHCPQCHAKQPLTAHGFYTRTLIDAAFDGVIRVRRYLCQACRRTVSLLPEFILRDAVVIACADEKLPTFHIDCRRLPDRAAAVSHPCPRAA